MKQHLDYLFKKLNFPEDASKQLLEAYDVLACNEDFLALVDRFYADENLTVPETEKQLDGLVNATGLNPHTLKYLYYCCLTKELPEKYKAAGISEDIMWDSLQDLRYKLFECLEVKGVPGFFACAWFTGFFRLRLFKLGRLEFGITTYKGPDTMIGDTEIKNGARVIDIHIPSSGESFDQEARYDAYDKAYHFFREVLHEELEAFTCNSWLLFPEHYSMLKPTSNIISFMDDFKIVSSNIYEDKKAHLWRFFGHHAEKPFEELPRTNSLWKAYAERLCAGLEIGGGKGLFIWDPVNKKTVK